MIYSGQFEIRMINYLFDHEKQNESNERINQSRITAIYPSNILYFQILIRKTESEFKLWNF